jgi:DNA-binding CsgD family transcriptional regulator
MLNSLNPQQLLNKIFGIQKDIYAKEIDKIAIIKANYLNEFSQSENAVRILFDHINFKILHITENVGSLSGYLSEEILNLNILFALNLISLDHYDFMYVWVNWAITRHLKYGDSFDAKQVMCGVKMKHKDGRIMRLLFRHYPLETTEEGVATLSAISIDDVTHLIKSDFYWGRIECGKVTKQTHHLISLDNKDIPHDILSEREKSIVKLLAQGKESKEIATILFISSHTVDNHRRNMINRIGVRDTTGLIQICKMCGMI